MFSPWVFDEYERRYERLFHSIYPSRNSTGFPERNLTVNLCHAFEHDATALFEMQFGSSNREHLDGVLLSDRLENDRELALIESKRFKSPSAVETIGKDIGRIYRCFYELKKENLVPETRRIDMSSVRTVFGCELADVWVENRFKDTVCESYRNGTFLDVFKKDIFAGIASGLRLDPWEAPRVADLIIKQVERTIQYDVRGGLSPQWPHDYYLVSFFWVIEDEAELRDAFEAILHNDERDVRWDR